jgi:hypothetical protein
MQQRMLALRGEDLVLTRRGEEFLDRFGVVLEDNPRRPAAKSCLDWSMRRSHLAGRAGAALLERIVALGWASRDPGSRAMVFTRGGEQKFARLFAV